MGISKWNAGIIRPVPVAPAGPYGDGAAPGVWTLDQQAYWQKQGLWPIQGNVNPDLFIENLFSTYLYTGNGSTQTITNGIDLAGKGGLVWGKSRSNAYDNFLADSVRGSSKLLYSNNTYSQQTDANVFSSFNSNGFSLGIGGAVSSNTNGATYVSWTFREQPKFFDVVTATAVGSVVTFAHNLGSTPGFVIIKKTSGIEGWYCYHTSLGTGKYITLNTTGAADTLAGSWTVSSTSVAFNYASAGDYVAYIFANDAGGFGLTGTDNVISCGTFTASAGETATVTLGYEPQFLLFKPSSTTGDWQIVDTMRPWPVAADAFSLKPNTTAAEANFGAIKPSSTGFYATSNLTANATYIYIAIRRGPMAVPTLGTSVFAPITYTGDGAATRTITTGIKTDLIIGGDRGSNAIGAGYTNDRLRGQAVLNTTTNDAEGVNAAYPKFDSMTGYTNLATGGAFNATGFSYIRWAFQRAPGFFDEVCYTGTGVAGLTITHNLGVAPELIIVKGRNYTVDWAAYSATLGNTKYLLPNTTAAEATSSFFWNNTSPTATTFTLGISGRTNNTASNTYVAYLFATCPGVSKVGSYTGTGALQTVACGFTSGARYVLIKRTDSTGDWYVWDSARGITSGNDPYLLLNDTAAEVTGTNYVDTDTTGFKVTAAAPAGINASGGTYIFLAIA